MQIVALVPYGFAWACFSWDIVTRTFAVADPLDLHKTTTSIELKHADQIKILHDMLMAVLCEVHQTDKFLFAWDT